MAQPKRRTSKSKKKKRRSHDSLSSPNLVRCSNCSAYILPHRVCPDCGFYKGRQIVIIEEEE